MSLTDPSENRIPTVVGTGKESPLPRKFIPSARELLAGSHYLWPTNRGIEATRRITAEMSNICIIGLSTHDEDNIVKEMKNAGASAYLTKAEAFESLEPGRSIFYLTRSL